MNPATNAAANPGPMTEALNNRIAYSDRENYKPWSNEKEVLKGMLKRGQGKDFYRKALSRQRLHDHLDQCRSSRIGPSTRSSRALIVRSQARFRQVGASKASRVEVDSNLWRADATKAAMRGAEDRARHGLRANNERYSDQARMKGWTSEKARLEKALKVGQDKAAYAEQLKKLGYQITSTNESEKDYWSTRSSRATTATRSRSICRTASPGRST